MKLEELKHDVSTVGALEKTEFKINASYKAYELLGDKLYSDKIGSIIRELSCNALDAHKLVGKEDVPFEVKLPTAFDNKFYIRDFGPGLSPTEIKEVYTTYFESTKNESNDFVGAFGLGSKTPFAYTNSFTVISRHEGMKRIYVAAMDNSGPSISLLSESETDEPSGLEVGFSVKMEAEKTHRYRARYVDQEFRNKLIEQLKFFKVKPTVLTDSGDIEWPEFKEKFSGDNWFMTDRKGYAEDCLNVIVGNICYNIQHEYIDRDLVIVFRNLNYSHYFTVPIGTVNVSVSREDLSYDEKTIKSLHEYLEKFRESAKIELDKVYVEKCNVNYDYYWDACSAYASLKTHDDMKNLCAFIQKEPFVLYKGKEHTDHKIQLWTDEMFDAINNKDTHVGDFTASVYTKVYKDTGIKLRIGSAMRSDTGYFSNYTGYYNRNPDEKRVNGFFDFTKYCYRYDKEINLNDIAVIHHDKSKISMGSINRWATANKHKYVLIISIKDDKKLEEYKKFIKYEKDIPKASEVCADYQNTSTGYSVTRDEQYVRTYNGSSSLPSYWINGDVDFDAGGFYIPVKNYNITPSGFMSNANLDSVGAIDTFMVSVRNILKDDAKYKDHSRVVVGVKLNAQKYYKEDPKWINVFDYVDDVIKRAKKSKRFDRLQKIQEALDIVDKDSNFSNFIEVLTYLQEDKKMKPYYHDIDDPQLRDLCDAYHNKDNDFLIKILTLANKNSKTKYYPTLEEFTNKYYLYDAFEYGYRYNMKAKTPKIISYINSQHKGFEKND